MEKKISWQDYCYVTRRNGLPWWCKVTNYYTIFKGESGGGCYIARAHMRWFWYLLLWLPAQIAQILYCMWDGGLKKFELVMPRHEHGAIFYIFDKRYPDSTYNRLDKIWESYD